MIFEVIREGSKWRFTMKDNNKSATKLFDTEQEALESMAEFVNAYNEEQAGLYY